MVANIKNSFSHFCAAHSKDHLSWLWTKLCKICRSSTKKNHLLQYGRQSHCWKI